MVKDESEGDIEFSGKPGSFKEVVMNHLTRITKLFSVELRGGYYTITKMKTGEEKEFYIQDSREALENSIYCLALLILNKFDSPMKKHFKEFEDDLVTSKGKFLKRTTSIGESEVLGEGFYTDEEKVFLEEYKIKKMEMYKGLFKQLSILLDKKNYFEIGGGVY